MSTRANILVLFGLTKLYLYRHSDGYPAVNGADICEAMQAAGKDATKFVGALLAKQYEATSFSPARPIYEVTTDVHGDIEWFYCVKFDRGAHRDRDPTIGWGHRAPGDDEGLRVPNPINTVEDLRQLVNADRKRINRRIGEMKRENPGNKHYQDMDDYQMIEPATAAVSA